MKIKVLGPGCRNCEQTEANVRDAVRETGVDAEVEKVTDFKEIASYGVLVTPAVVIGGDVKSVGKIPTKEEIRTWIEAPAANKA